MCFHKLSYKPICEYAPLFSRGVGFNGERASVEAHRGQVTSVLTEFFHICGNRERRQRGDSHVLLGNVEEDSVVLGYDLDLIRVQEKRQLAEDAYPRFSPE